MIKMAHHGASEGFVLGIGLAYGLTMTQYLAQFMKPPERKQVIVCLRCGSRNPIENKFCGQCGSALYPPPPIQCPRCGSLWSPAMNFCGRCGSPLKKTENIRKKRSSKA
jgi:rRNA maturation endonuclease Nob1